MGKKSTKRKVVIREIGNEANEEEEMEEDPPVNSASEQAAQFGQKFEEYCTRKDKEVELLKETVELQRQHIEQLQALLAATSAPITPEAQPEDEGYSPVSHKRRKDASPSTSSPTTNRGTSKKVRTADHPPRQHPEEDRNHAGTSTENPPPRTAGTASQQAAPPPIVIAPEEDWLQTSEAFLNSGLKFSRARQCADGVRVQPTSPDDYRQMVALLQQRGVAFHSFQLQEDKTLKVVVRGVPTSVKEAPALAALREQGLPATSVVRMKGRQGRPYPLLYVQLEKTDAGKRIFQMEKLLSLDVRVEPKRRGIAPTQCHRCQGIGHGQSRCERRPVCVKCAGPHSTQNCRDPRRNPPLAATATSSTQPATEDARRF